MQILGKFWADVRVAKSCKWPRDRWSDFRKLGIKEMRKTWKKHLSHEENVSRSAAYRDAVTDLNVQGGGQIDPPPCMW